MEYLNKLISKWMPPSKRVAVDSHPRLSGIMDTVNSTLAHGPETRLPSEFYDRRGRDIIDKIGVEEWFSGYKESNEYRTVGIGSLVGDIVSRMIGSVEGNGNDGLLEVAGRDDELGAGRRGETDIRFAMSGCHDTTLAAILSSLGAFEGEKWPPYTSHIAVELFREKARQSSSLVAGRTSFDEKKRIETAKDQKQSLWSSIFGPAKEKLSGSIPAPEGIARKTMDELSAEEKKKLNGYYVRIRYNDRPMTVPGCKLPGKHLEGDTSFCTLVSRASRYSLLWLTSGRRRSKASPINSHRNTGRNPASRISMVPLSLPLQRSPDTRCFAIDGTVWSITIPIVRRR